MEENQENVEVPVTQSSVKKQSTVTIPKKYLFYLIGVIVLFVGILIVIAIVFLYFFNGKKTEDKPMPQKKPKKPKPKVDTPIKPIDVSKKEAELREETIKELTKEYENTEIPKNMVVLSESEREQDVKDDDELN